MIEIVFCVGVKKFLLLFMMRIPKSCFKLMFLQKAIIACILWNVSLILLYILNMDQYLFMCSVYLYILQHRFVWY